MATRTKLRQVKAESEIPADAPITGPRPDEKVPLFEARNIMKRYGSFIALNNMNFHIGHNEVVGLLGDNGAGKSTLVKMISGINPPTSGEILVNGKPTQLRTRSDSEAAGIETIYQDIALVDSMSITRNIFMGREITKRWGFMDHQKMQDVAIDILGSAVQISGIDNPEKEVGFLSGGQKQAVAHRLLLPA